MGIYWAISVDLVEVVLKGNPQKRRGYGADKATIINQPFPNSTPLISLSEKNLDSTCFTITTPKTLESATLLPFSLLYQWTPQE